MDYLTNQYAKYAPTKVGDTTKETALLYKTKADQYDLAKKNIREKEEDLLSMSSLPGYHKEQLDEFNEHYSNKVGELAEQGDFENNVDYADSLIDEGNANYNLRGIASSSKQWQEQLAEIDESENSERIKNIQRKQLLFNNPGYDTDPETGEKQFESYSKQGIKKDQNIDEKVLKQYKDWVADGYLNIKINEDGSFASIDVKKGAPGYLAYLEGKTIDEEELRGVVIRYLSNTGELDEALDLQSEANTLGKYYETGEYTSEDLLNVAARGIPYEEGSPEYEEELEAFQDKMALHMDKEKEVQGNKFNESATYARIASALEKERLKRMYSDNLVRHVGFEDLKIKTLLDKDAEEAKNNSGGSGDTDYGIAGSNVLVTTPTVGASDSSTPGDQVAEARRVLIPAIKANKQELKELKESREKGGEGTTISSIQSLEKKIEQQEKDLDSYDLSSQAYGATITSKIGLGGSKYLYEKKKKSYNKYEEAEKLVRNIEFSKRGGDKEGLYDTKGGSFGDRRSRELALNEHRYTPYEGTDENVGSNKFHSREHLKALNLIAVAKEVYSSLDDSYDGESPLTDEQFNTAFNSRLDGLAGTSDRDNGAGLFNLARKPFEKIYFPEIVDKLKKFKELNPKETFYQRRNIFSINSFNVGNGKKSPSIIHYEQVMDEVGKMAILDRENLMTERGITVQEEFEELQEVYGENAVISMNNSTVDLYGTLINGKVALRMNVPISGKDDEDKVLPEDFTHPITYYLESGTGNDSEAKSLLKGSFSAFERELHKGNEDGMLTPDKEAAYATVVEIYSALDGTIEKWTKQAFSSMDNGDTRKFSFGDHEFKYTSFRDKDGDLNFITQNQNVTAKDKNGFSHDNVKGVLGWKKAEYYEEGPKKDEMIPNSGNLDRDGNPIVVNGVPARAEYYMMNEDKASPNNPYNVRSINGKKEVEFNDSWFQPRLTKNTEELRRRSKLEAANKNGTFDENAVPPIYKDYPKYFEKHSSERTVNDLIETKRERYTKQGYVPLTDIVPATSISAVVDGSDKGVNIPYVNLSPDGIIKAKALFDRMARDGKVMITGGSSDETNIVKGRDPNTSLHEEGLAFDVLKTSAAKTIIELWNVDDPKQRAANQKLFKKVYGVISILDSYNDGHLHIGLDKSMANNK